MGRHTSYAGDLALWKAARPDQEADLPLDDNDLFHNVFWALRDKLDDTRLFSTVIADFASYDNSMGFNLCEDYAELNPRAAARSIVNAAEILGKWGCYMDGNLFGFIDYVGRMYRLVVDRNWVRLYRYDHEGTFREDEPIVKLTKVIEHDTSGCVDPDGELPLSKEDEAKRQKELEKERKRKREQDEDEETELDTYQHSPGDQVKGVNAGDGAGLLEGKGPWPTAHESSSLDKDPSEPTEKKLCVDKSA